MRNFKKRAMSAALGGVMAASVVLVGGSPAAAATCPSVAEPVTTGGKAKWTLECYRGALKVYGWVEDTRLDGKCARVDVDWHNSRQIWSRSACGFKERTNFDMKMDGTSGANVTLYIE